MLNRILRSFLLDPYHVFIVAKMEVFEGSKPNVSKHLIYEHMKADHLFTSVPSVHST